jgi:hypothetical protein
MKNLISLWIALLFLAGAVTCFAMGGGEPQRPADQDRATRDAGDAERPRDTQPPRTQEWYEEAQQPGWVPQDRQEREGDMTLREYLGMDEPERHAVVGILDRADDHWVLVVDDRAYRLELEDEEQAERLMGQQVEVWGSITMEVETMTRAGVLRE